MLSDLFNRTVLRSKLLLGSVLRGPRAWEEIEEHLVPALIRIGASSIDVGANTGSYTRRMALCSRTVHAIEPVPDLIRHLEHLKLSNIVIHRNVASAEESEMELWIPIAEGEASLGLGSLEHSTLDPQTTFQTLQTSSVKLDRFAGEDIGFVKIDVEGHEMAVLEGAKRLITCDRPNFLIEVEERHREGAIEDMSAFMHDLGYQSYFCQKGQIHPLDALSPAMLDTESLAWKCSRVKMPYVNNFLFLPSETAADTLPLLRHALLKISLRYGVA